MIPALTYLFALAQLALAAAAAAAATTRNVYTFPVGTWIENLLVRPNGNILATDLSTGPKVYNVDPSARRPFPVVVASFADFNESAASGIVQSLTCPDTYYVLSSSPDVQTLTDRNARLFSLRVTGAGNATRAADLRPIASFPDSSLMNGLTALPGTPLILASDSSGKVWSVDSRSGRAQVVVSGEPLMTPPPNSSSIGVNGIKVLPPSAALGTTCSYLYFTSTAPKILGRIAIDAATGRKLGGPRPAAQRIWQSATGVDDFALDVGSGAAYVSTSSDNSVVEVSFDGRARIVAGSTDSDAIADPTSVALGLAKGRRGGGGTYKGLPARQLYVSTNGGLGDGNVVSGGQIVEVDGL